jgi:hypothetical protein
MSKLLRHGHDVVSSYLLLLICNVSKFELTLLKVNYILIQSYILSLNPSRHIVGVTAVGYCEQATLHDALLCSFENTQLLTHGWEVLLSIMQPY